MKEWTAVSLHILLRSSPRFPCTPMAISAGPDVIQLHPLLLLLLLLLSLLLSLLPFVVDDHLFVELLVLPQLIVAATGCAQLWPYERADARPRIGTDA